MDPGKARGIILLIILIACVLLFVFGDTFLGSYPVCFYNKWLGIPCPLCGLTRAAFELMHFHFRLAWNFNPLIYPLLIWFGLETACYFRNKSKWLFLLLRIYRFFLVGLILLLLVLRAFKYFPLP